MQQLEPVRNAVGIFDRSAGIGRLMEPMWSVVPIQRAKHTPQTKPMRQSTVYQMDLSETPIQTVPALSESVRQRQTLLPTRIYIFL